MLRWGIRHTADYLVAASRRFLGAVFFFRGFRTHTATICL